MTRLLHISASPRGQASESLALADAFLQAHQDAHPDVQVDHLDLHDGTLPAFGRLAAGAKMAVLGGGQPSPDQAAAWDAARAVFDRFAAEYESSRSFIVCSVPAPPRRSALLAARPRRTTGTTPRPPARTRPPAAAPPAAHSPWQPRSCAIDLVLRRFPRARGRCWRRGRS